MKNLKFLSFLLLCGVLILSGCEKANNQENLSCEGEEICTVDENADNSSLEIEAAPTIIIDDNQGGNGMEGDLNGNGEGEREGEFENNEQINEEPVDKPLMKIMIDEDMSAEEIEITASQTCEALGGTWNEGDCTLADGSKVYF